MVHMILFSLLCLLSLIKNQNHRLVIVNTHTHTHTHTHTRRTHDTHTNIHTDDATGDRVPNCVMFFLAFLSTLSTNPSHYHVANSFNFFFSKNSFCCFLNVWNIVSIWFNVASSWNNVIFLIGILTSIKKNALNRMLHLSGCAHTHTHIVRDIRVHPL